MTVNELNQYRNKKGVSYTHIQKKLSEMGIDRTVQNVRQILLGERTPKDSKELMKAIKKILS